MSPQVGRWATAAGHIEVGLLSPEERQDRLRRLAHVRRLRSSRRRPVVRPI